MILTFGGLRRVYSHTPYQVYSPHSSSVSNSVLGAKELLGPPHACTDLVHHARHLDYKGGHHLAAHSGLGLVEAR